MTKEKRSFVAGVLPTLEQADAAVNELLDAGFPKNNIGFLTRETEEIRKQIEAEAAGDATIVRAVGGGFSGGLLGGVLGSLAALVIPALGPIILVGLFAAAGGAIAGTFAGLMSTVGLSDEEIAWFHAELEAGRSVIVVRTDGRYSEALAIMRAHGAYDMTRQRETEQATTD